MKRITYMERIDGHLREFDPVKYPSPFSSAAVQTVVPAYLQAAEQVLTTSMRFGPQVSDLLLHCLGVDCVTINTEMLNTECQLVDVIAHVQPEWTALRLFSESDGQIDKDQVKHARRYFLAENIDFAEDRVFICRYFEPQHKNGIKWLPIGGDQIKELCDMYAERSEKTSND